MKEKPLGLKPTLGIKIVLTILCLVGGAVLAYYLFR